MCSIMHNQAPGDQVKSMEELTCSSFSESGFYKSSCCQDSSVKPLSVLRCSKGGQRLGGTRGTDEESGWFVQVAVSRDTEISQYN